MNFKGSLAKYILDNITEEIYNHLNQNIEGWGDIFADLEIKKF